MKSGRGLSPSPLFKTNKNMIKEKVKGNQKLFRSSLELLEKLGHTDIEARIEGYITPKSYTLKQENIQLTPDIVSMSPTGAICYTEIAMRTEEEQLIKSKWNFLQTMATMKNGIFQVVAHKGNFTVAQELVDHIDSSIPIIRIR